jgi:hypothetical protein
VLVKLLIERIRHRLCEVFKNHVILVFPGISQPLWLGFLIIEVINFLALSPSSLFQYSQSDFINSNVLEL